MSSTLIPVKVTRSEIDQYRAEIAKQPALLSTLKESFEFDFCAYEGVTREELDRVIQCAGQPLLQQLINSAPLVGKRNSKQIDRNSNGNSYMKAFYTFKKYDDGTYDFVYCVAAQKKSVNWAKFGIGIGTAVALGSVAAGVALCVPVAGIPIAAAIGAKVGVSVGAGAAVAGAAVGGAAGLGVCGEVALEEAYTRIPNVILGYIGRELENSNILSIVEE